MAAPAVGARSSAHHVHATSEDLDEPNGRFIPDSILVDCGLDPRLHLQRADVVGQERQPDRVEVAPTPPRKSTVQLGEPAYAGPDGALRVEARVPLGVERGQLGAAPSV